MKCPLFAIVDVRRTQRLILHSLPLPQHSLEGSPARRSFPRSRNGTSRLGLRGKERRRRRRSGGSGGTYSWSVRPAATAARARSEAKERGELEMGTACSRDLSAVNRPTDQPTCLSRSLGPPLLLLLLMKRKTQEVGKSDGRTVGDGVKDGRNGGRGEKE